MTLFSCNKNTPIINSNLTGPTLILTPNSLSGLAGDLVSIDYTSGSLIGIKEIKVEEQFQSFPTNLLKDTFLAAKPKASDLNFNYRIPDSATAGQKSILTFTVIDTAGKSISKQATVSITASRPRIGVSQNVATGHPGDSVIFTLTMQEVDNNLDSLIISQSVNGTVPSKIAGYSLTNPTVDNLTYVYHVSNTTVPGDNIGLLFTVSNKVKVTNVASRSVMVN